jgi:Rrf2 family protein
VKFSTKTLYGLKAVLVLASRFGEGSLSVSQIAKKEGISVPYLEQILNSLKRKGLVKSVRGPQGGYVLAKKPSEISLESLFYTLEEKPSAALNGKLQVTPETDEVAIANLMFWGKLKASLEKGLSEITLKDLLDDARKLKKGKSTASPYTFNI